MRGCFVLIVAVASLTAYGQQPTAAADQRSTAQAMPDWQKAAGGHMEFEVASVRVDTSSDFKPPSFPLSADDSFTDTGGLFRADFSLPVYIQFAYKLWLTPDQMRTILDKLPAWVSKDKFLIEGRAQGHPSKDQYRLMMQSLLTSRFGLKMHFESREEPVYATVLIKPGKLGPKLRPHSEGPPCDPQPTESSKVIPTTSDVFPGQCDVFSMKSLPNRNFLLGSRNTPLEFIASVIPIAGAVNRPVVDRTGLEGRYDFTVEFSMEATRGGKPGGEAQEEVTGTPFVQAAEEQLGIKLVPTKAVLQIPVIDAVERPSEN